MRYYVTIGDRTLEVDLTGATPLVDGSPVRAEITSVPGTPVRHLVVDGRSFPLLVAEGERAGDWRLDSGAARLTAEVVDERTRAIREMTGPRAEAVEKSLTAPMPGLVVRIEVEAGQAVKAGQGLVIVEAMKMENELKARGDGIVSEIRVEPGQTVEKGAVLLVLE